MGKSGKTFKRLAVGAAVAGAAGYLAGLLTAPKSGKQTREELRAAANAKVTETEKQLKGMHTELGNLVDEAKGKGSKLNGRAHKELSRVVDQAKDSKQKVREVLSAIHEGDASDKDLKRAISDAKHAIDHIKDYLKK